MPELTYGIGDDWESALYRAGGWPITEGAKSRFKRRPGATAVLLCGVSLMAAKSTLNKPFTVFGQAKAGKTPKMRQ